MKLEDVDIVLEHPSGVIKLSELTEDDLSEIKGLTAYIINSNVFRDPCQALIAAFHLFADSFIETNEYLKDGNHHH